MCATVLFIFSPYFDIYRVKPYQNICDYRFYKTKQQAIHEWETSPCLRERQLTQAEVIKDWEKFYRRK
ncbi:hypothetical protein GQA12_08420 [Paenibacillus alvei]|nr:hypothetical protein [Paenibacillus alvei]